jgi:hypothetical protein
MLLLVMIGSAVDETMSFAASVPFLSVLAGPARFWQGPRIRGLTELLA